MAAYKLGPNGKYLAEQFTLVAIPVASEARLMSKLHRAFLIVRFAAASFLAPKLYNEELLAGLL